ncbi:MAG: MlaD family protein [Coxiellaceae bacterium]|nr:MlaD family protein [Coxiellaceae bacterium]
MDNKVNYTLVGTFVILLVAVLVVIFIWLEGLNKQDEAVHYQVLMNESVAGLTPKAQVTFNGVKIGSVQTIELDPKDPQKVRLVLAVKANTPINQSTVAMLKSQGITGVTYVGLSATRRDAPALKKQPGQTYATIPSKPSLLETLSDALEDVTQNIKQLTVSVGKIVDDKNRKAIADSLQSIKQVTKNLAQNQRNFNEIIDSTQVLTKNIAVSTKDLPETVKQLNKTLIALKGMARKITKTGDSIDSTMEGANALVQNVSQQVVPQTTELVTTINATIREINHLTNQLQNNPSMLLRGQKSPPLGPGERR